jgi:hypothetical protein
MTVRQLSTEPFTGHDLRAFHHFLLVARPHLPFGSEESWTSLVPAYAHEVGTPAILHIAQSLSSNQISVRI